MENQTKPNKTREREVGWGERRDKRNKRKQERCLKKKQKTKNTLVLRYYSKEKTQVRV